MAHGYDRTTTDLYILVTRDGLKKIHEALDGLGYVPPFAGSKHLREGNTKVHIEFLTTGGYPGDLKAKPSPFQIRRTLESSSTASIYLQLERLIESKLASGMSNLGRLKDLADVVELIKAVKLPADFAAKLNPYTRDKYLELWNAIARSPVDNE